MSRDASGNAGTAAAGFTTLPAAPLVTSVTPPQAAQGTTLEVTLIGAFFTDDFETGGLSRWSQVAGGP